MSQLNWSEILGWGEEQIADLRNTAYSYIRQGVYDVAFTFFDAIAVLGDATPYDLQTVGALCLQKGEGLKALDFLDRALKLEPDHLLTQLNRAKALFMLGYKKQGTLQAEALAHCEDAEIAAQAQALLLAYR
jgi:tetratricopeptide (TPR) repeat protein